MLKKIFASLLSLLFIAPSAAVLSAKPSREPVFLVNSTKEVRGVDGHNYDEETITESGWDIIHTYSDDNFVPTLKKDFYAPSGYAFYLEISDSVISNIMEEIQDVPDVTYKTLGIIFGYTFFGTQVTETKAYFYNETQIADKSTTGNPVDGMAAIIKEIVRKHVVYKSDEIKQADDVSAYAMISVSNEEQKNYRLKLNTKPIHIEPFDESDYVIIEASYHLQTKSAHISSAVIGGFFNNSIYENPFGFTIDENTDHEFCLIANGTTIARFTNEDFRGITISVPNEGIEVQTKIQFISGGVKYEYYSHKIFLKDPGFGLSVGEYRNRDTVQRDTEYPLEFELGGLGEYELNLNKNSVLKINLMPFRLNDKERGHELYNDQPLPPFGEPGHYYYQPSDNENTLYNEGRFDELNALRYEGTYYVADENGNLTVFNGQKLFDENISKDSYNPDFNKKQFSVDYAGKWEFVSGDIRFFFQNVAMEFANHTAPAYYWPLEVVVANDETDTINLNVEDEVNLLIGGNTIDIIPSLSNSSDEVYYFNWKADKEGIIDYYMDETGKLTITPLRAGLVNLTVTADSKFLSQTDKTISVRVMDSIYGIAKLVVPDEFHYAEQELTVSVDIRGITKFQNIDVTWKVVDKGDKELEENKDYRVNDNATLTMLKPKSTDYKVTAYYEGVEIGTISLHFGYLDVNKFLKHNIWWIALITLGLVFVVVFLKHLTSRGRTTVQRIDYVYSSLSTFLSNDKLSKNEAKRTKRLITSCLNSCEDLNIEASNQYEKAIRYLRKSLTDIKSILNGWNKNDETEKSVLIDRLVTDLAKALNVAKEIETAREIIDANHQKANKKNFEYIETPKPEKKEKK